jgi:hypothetical protein
MCSFEGAVCVSALFGHAAFVETGLVIEVCGSRSPSKEVSFAGLSAMYTWHLGTVVLVSRRTIFILSMMYFVLWYCSDIEYQQGFILHIISVL